MRRIVTILLLYLCFMPQVNAEIKGQTIDYNEGGTVLKGFLAYDDSIKGKRPGIIVVHEWWGHNDYARKRAKMLAELGYTALAVDMYGDGKQASHPEEAGKFAGEVANNIELGKARFIAALDVLKKHQSTNQEKIAAIGYCFGGGIVLQMAREGIDLDGVVSFHGSLATQRPAQSGVVKAKVLVSHGEDDPFIKPEQITAFKQEMDSAKVDYKFIAYPGAVHAFTNPDADKYGEKFNLPLKYDAKADHASWNDMQEFFKSIF